MRTSLKPHSKQSGHADAKCRALLEKTAPTSAKLEIARSKPSLSSKLRALGSRLKESLAFISVNEGSLLPMLRGDSAHKTPRDVWDPIQHCIRLTKLKQIELNGRSFPNMTAQSPATGMPSKGKVSAARSICIGTHGRTYITVQLIR